MDGSVRESFSQKHMRAKKILRRSLYAVISMVGLAILLMLVPRTHGALFPEKPPMGYHFLWSNYLAIWAGLEDLINTTPEIPDSVEATMNIEYKNVDGSSLQLDLYRRKGVGEGAPLLIFVHGGSWIKGKRGDMLPLLIDFAERGYVTATVSYRLGPNPQGAEDIYDAVKWFFTHGEEFGYDADRIALIGASAGAHLVMLAAYQEDKIALDSGRNTPHIRAVINIFGPVDLTTDYAINRPMVKRFIGKSYQEAPRLYEGASPIRFIDASSPPTMTIQGTSDELVPNSQADQLKHKLDSAGVPCVDYRFPLWPHAMILVQRVYDYCLPIMDDFLQKHLAAEHIPATVKSESL